MNFAKDRFDQQPEAPKAMPHPLMLVSVMTALFLTIPIWYYLLYQILVRVEASDLMWFLFWVYVPFGLFVRGCDMLVAKYIQQLKLVAEFHKQRSK